MGELAQRDPWGRRRMRSLPKPAGLLRSILRLGTLVALVAPACGPPIPAERAAKIRQVGPELLGRVSGDAGKDWLTYGGDYSNSRFSPLAQIDTSNVASLALRYSWRTGAGKVGSFETSPLVAQGIMYLTTPRHEIIALDVRRGQELWRFAHTVGSLALCCGPANRGAALAYGKVYFGTLDSRLMAVDAISGKLLWNVAVDRPRQGYSITMAPLVIDSLVVIGVSGAEFPIRGHLSAYHVNTGRLAWRWHAIPSPADGGWWGRWTDTTPTGEKLGRDIAREKADSARYPDAWRRGGGSLWTTPAYDPRTHRLYLGVGNPAPSYRGAVRPGDNLYTGSIVGLDARTGQLVWYFQYVPHDAWDMDAASPPLLVRQGERTLVVHAGKTGWTYILDAEDGSLVRRSEPFVPQENLFARPTAAGIRMSPGSFGGANWSPLSYSPRTGWVYVVASHKPMRFRTLPDPLREATNHVGGRSSLIPGEPVWGTISAVGLKTGRIAWQIRTEQPMVGGSLATRGGLVFTGEGSGWFRAYHAGTGRKLWEYRAAAGVNAPPVTFEVDGKQMVAVAAGGNATAEFPLGDELLVFQLPGDR